MRDFAKDRELCGLMPHGPYLLCAFKAFVPPGYHVVAKCCNLDVWGKACGCGNSLECQCPCHKAASDAMFFQAATEGWPAALAELQRMEAREAAVQKLVEAARKMFESCIVCKGTGHLSHYEYDAASGEMEWAGTKPCDDCGALRAALEPFTSEGATP